MRQRPPASTNSRSEAAHEIGDHLIEERRTGTISTVCVTPRLPTDQLSIGGLLAIVSVDSNQGPVT